MTPTEIAESVKRLRVEYHRTAIPLQTINALVQLVGEMDEMLAAYKFKYGIQGALGLKTVETLTKAKPIAELAKEQA